MFQHIPILACGLVVLYVLAVSFYELTSWQEVRAIGRQIFGERLWKLLENNLSGFGYGFVLAGIPFITSSEKASTQDTIGWVCLGAAWVMFTLSIIRTGFFAERPYRRAKECVSSAVIFVALLFLARMLPSKRIMPTLVQSTPEVKLTAPEAATAQPQVMRPTAPAPVSIPTPVSVYDLSGRRRQAFLALLNTQVEKRDIIRIGCISSMEDSCISAGKFLLLISEAGWVIDSNKVFRLEPSIPPDGMTVAAKTPRYTDNLPPHQGHWTLMDRTNQTFWRTFTWMQIPVSGSGDPDMPDGVLGIYFGPEPKNTAMRSHLQAQTEFAKLVLNFTFDFGQLDIACKVVTDECKQKSLQIKQGVAAFLEYCDCGLNPRWLKAWNAIVLDDSDPDSPQITGKQKNLLDKLMAALKKGKA